MSIGALATPVTGPMIGLLGLLMAQVVPGPIDVVVTAAPPVDGQRLADALRAYLDEYGIRVESVAATEPADLRRQLADARRIGEAVRAMAVVRAQSGARGMIEIELCDLATQKVLIAEIPRPLRDEDLYRALALKIQASLRATLSEAPELIEPQSGLVRLASSPAGAPPATALVSSTATSASWLASPLPPARFSLETGYLLLAFPFTTEGPALQGLSVVAAFTPRPWLEVTLGTAALGSAHAEGSGVVAAATVLPFVASVRLRVAGRRTEALFGPIAELAYVAITPSSPTTLVRATRDVLPALGGEVEGRLRVTASTWFYGRAAALGVLAGARYQVEGQSLVDTSGAQVSGSLGIGLDLR